MIHGPSELLRQAMIDAGLGSVSLPAEWPVFSDHAPNKPDALICIYDTTGVLEGRIQRTGETIEKPGWQVMVRAADYRTGRSKMSLISAWMDTVRNCSVMIDGVVYGIVAVSKKGTIISVGQETTGDRRNVFTLNGTVTIKADAPPEEI